MILDLERRTVECAAGHREVAPPVVHLDLTVAYCDTGKIRRQRTARPNFQATAAWADLHVSIGKALDDSARPFFDRTIGIKASIEINADKGIAYREYKANASVALREAPPVVEHYLETRPRLRICNARATAVDLVRNF